MRSFRRFHTDIPVSIISGSSSLSPKNQQLYDVSYGGLSCHSETKFDPGNLISVRIPNVDPPFEGTGTVIWCDPKENGYELGVQFNEGREAFVARMVQQVCQIEQYKSRVRETEGRELTGDEAAAEWIEKNAHKQEVQERAFIRHPLDIPIELARAEVTTSFRSKLRNFSMEGACFDSKTAIKLGEHIRLEIPPIDEHPEQTLEGVVIWCRENGGCYEIGVRFEDDREDFNSRMLRQLSRLECFREEILRQDGRELSGEELVTEFIAYMAKLNMKAGAG